MSMKIECKIFVNGKEILPYEERYGDPEKIIRFPLVVNTEDSQDKVLLLKAAKLIRQMVWETVCESILGARDAGDIMESNLSSAALE